MCRTAVATQSQHGDSARGATAAGVGNKSWSLWATLLLGEGVDTAFRMTTKADFDGPQFDAAQLDRSDERGMWQINVHGLCDSGRWHHSRALELQSPDTRTRHPIRAP